MGAKHLYKSAKQCIDNDDYERAVELLSRYLAECPEDSQAYYQRAVAYDGLGIEPELYGEKPPYTQEAITDYELAIKLGFESPEIFWHLALDYFRQNNWMKTIENIQLYQKPEERDSFLSKMIVTCYFNAGKLTECIEAAPVVIEDPLYRCDIRRMRGISYFYQGKFQHALEDFERIIEIRKIPEAGYIYTPLSTFVLRAITLTELGRYKEAVKEFTTSIERDIFPRACLIQRARCYQALGFDEEAAADLKESELHKEEDVFRNSIMSMEAV
ncbi:MAG: hypothetical protein K2Y22_15900 [Candidatus Obscuribacterales bacterium]|nr:hypothetical protein [Candidatus Obscuribacterales bacterium]